MDVTGSDSEHYEASNTTNEYEVYEPSQSGVTYDENNEMQEHVAGDNESDPKEYYQQDQENIDIDQSNEDGSYNTTEVENHQNQEIPVNAGDQEETVYDQQEEILYEEQPQDDQIQYVDEHGAEQVYEISSGEVQEIVASDDVQDSNDVEEVANLEETPSEEVLADTAYEEYVEEENKEEFYQEEGEFGVVEQDPSNNIYINEDGSAENLDENEQLNDTEIQRESDLHGESEEPSENMIEGDGDAEDDLVKQDETNVQYEDEDEDNDYEDAVDVEEDKVSEDGENENVAQHESDSDNEQDEEVNEEDVKLGHMSDYDVRDSDEDVVEEEAAGPSKTDETSADKPSQEDIAKMFDSESEDEGEKGEVGDLIADIFGESDDENEEFTGFKEEETSKSSKNKPLSAVISDSDEDDSNDAETEKAAADQQEGSSSDEGVTDNRKGSGIVYDFDLMLQRKKEERKGRRRRDGGTFISDSDDIINAMLTKMREAALADREANQQKKPALNKLKMLPMVVRHLKKQDLKEAFVDMGMIAAIADWLTLLPDRSLPHISIREELLKVLHDLPPVSPETLKTSGIGRAVMMIFKHPRETRAHKESAGRLINKWSRPIFGLNENFKSMTRGDREQRDLEQMPQSKRRRLSAGQPDGEKQEEATPEPGQLRPGERGFVMRARVPMPSNKDYVIRPKWNVESNEDEGAHRFNKRSKAKKDERLEKHLKNFADRRKNMKMQRAVGISIEGNKMPLS